MSFLLLLLAGCWTGSMAIGSMPQGVGVNIHFTAPKAVWMDRLKAEGFRYIRMDFAWSDIERKPGVYDFSAYDVLMSNMFGASITPLLILDYGNPLYDDGMAPRSDAGRQAFVNYVLAGMARYQKHGILWEIWNEPNIGFWRPQPNVDDYSQLAVAVGKAVRERFPNEILMAPGTSGVDLKFLEGTFQRGLLRYLDYVSIHPYRRVFPESVTDDFDSLKRLIDKYSVRPVPILVSEWGFSSIWNFTWGIMNETLQAKYLARMMMTNIAWGIKLTIWYDFKDDGTSPSDPEHHFGTLHFDDSPKVAFHAAETLRTQLGGDWTFSKKINVGVGYVMMAFTHPSAPTDAVYAVWAVLPIHAEVSLPLEGCYDLTDFDGTALGRQCSTGSTMKVHVTDGPLYLRFLPAVGV